MPAMPSNWPRSTSGGHRDLLRVHHRQLAAHVDVGAVGHAVVERQDGVGKGVDRGLVGAVRDGRARRSSRRTRGRSAAAWLARNSGSFLRRCSSVGAPSPVQTNASSASRATRSRMALREQRGAQRARADAVGQEAARRRASASDVVGGGVQVVGAVGDVAVDVAPLVAAAVAFHVDAPADEAALGEPVHHARVGPPRHRQVEGRLARPSTSRARTARPACRRASRRTSPTGTACTSPSAVFLCVQCSLPVTSVMACFLGP